MKALRGTVARARIRLVVTDLDNTLYDWVSSFVPSFRAMVDAAVRLLDVDREALLDELQGVHRRYGCTEHPDALLETGAVARRFPGASRAELRLALGRAFGAFDRVRRETLRLYPGVQNTLAELERMGCPVVGHTEAPLTLARFRLEALGVAPLVSALHAGARKPDPETLRRIMFEYDVSPRETLYVGDSFTRDVATAGMAGSASAWARYGRTFAPDLWRELARVTHWTAADVEREARLRLEHEGVRADAEVDGFGEILAEFAFASSAGKAARA